MLITDDFVLLNFPKTGTTFARGVIKNIYGESCEELLLSPAARASRPKAAGNQSQHGTYAQIPSEHRRKKVISITRNPFDRYVSQYYFRWYAHSPPADPQLLQNRYPGFPDISFPDFLDMLDVFAKKNILDLYGITSETTIGFQTIQFVAFYSANPGEALAKLVGKGCDAPIEIPEIQFLYQESLRHDLARILGELVPDKQVEQIVHSQEAQNVSRVGTEKDWRHLWTPEIYALYSEKEKPLLRLFPNYAPIDLA